MISKSRTVIRICIVIFFCSFLITILGCPCNCNFELYKYTGVIISNFPEWLSKYKYVNKFSEWKEWDSEHNLKSLFLDKYDKFDYKGMYRLIVEGQILGIEFDNGDSYVFMFSWLKPYESNKDINFVVEQNNSNDNIFEFDCISKFDFENNSLDKNAKVIFTKISEENTNIIFNYKLLIKEIEVINENFKILKPSYFENFNRPNWLPEFYYDNSMYDQIKYSIHEKYISDEKSIAFFYYPSLNGLLHDGCNFLDKITSQSLFYYGGLNEIHIDNSKKMVSYKLQEGSPIYPNYLDIIIDENNIANFVWYNLDSEGKQEILCRGKTFFE